MLIENCELFLSFILVYLLYMMSLGWLLNLWEDDKFKVMNVQELNSIAKMLVAEGKGILAADESAGTIKKRFDAISVESTPENHRIYRQLLFTTPEIEKYISGVILFDETIRQTMQDKPAAKLLEERGIIPGIKVDLGTKDMSNFPNEKVTEGLDGLRERLVEYKSLGARFTKWRAVIKISDVIPTDSCIYSNAENLGRFAALSQEAGLVPIVEPEVLMDGEHTIERSAEVVKRTLKEVFISLARHNVLIEGILLKPSWVHPGFDYSEKPTDEDIAKYTLKVYKEILPDNLPGVVFLSGGDSPTDSTSHLNALNKLDNVPWQLSFSFGRALQDPVLKTWIGKNENIKNAQEAFLKRARLNSLARGGNYSPEMENS